MPATPGTLSAVSPQRESISSIFSGGTPHFSITSFMPVSAQPPLLSGVIIVVVPVTSCIKSLSPERILHPRPCFSHSAATVAIISSASKPSFLKTGICRAVSISSITGTCACRSSGVLSLVALYSGYISCLKVGVRESNAAAIKPGLFFFSMLRRFLKKPNTAETFSFLLLTSGREIKAKYAL